MHIIKSVGWFFGITLLIVSIALVTLVVLLTMELRMSAAIPPAFVEDFTDTVNKRRFKEAYELAKEDPSFVARVLTAGMGRLQYGIEDAREASFSMLESAKASKDQLIVYLATIGTLGPLLGLVGTVFGMILSFMTLSSGSSINAQALADDISHALVITLLGIGLSVPAIFCHAYFKNRLTRLTHDAGTVADDLLTQMYYNSKKPGTTSTPDINTDARNVSASPAIKPK
jgi:biopolymer transport protein ExbB